jgi:hypothetical protein
MRALSLLLVVAPLTFVSARVATAAEPGATEPGPTAAPPLPPPVAPLPPPVAPLPSAPAAPVPSAPVAPRPSAPAAPVPSAPAAPVPSAPVTPMPSAIGTTGPTGTAASATTTADGPLVHAIYAQLPDLPEGDVTRRSFTEAAKRYHLAPLEVIDIAAAPPPKAPGTLKATIAKTQKLAFDEALKELDADLEEVSATGGAGLTTLELSDLYLHHAMAMARADWNAPVGLQMAAINQGRARAFDDYLRAAALAPDRTLDKHALPPQVVADFGRGLELARKLARVTLLLHGDSDAEVSIDGAPAIRIEGGLTVKDLPRGDHLIAVTELGRAAWGTSLSISNDTYELTIPARASLGLSDAVAADHARRMGAHFALLAERKPGKGARVELRLVDLSGTKRDAALVSTTGDERGAIDAAVMRLDEQARKILQLELAGTLTAATPLGEQPSSDATTSTLLAPQRPRATFHDDPAAWARDRWPLLTAIGVVTASAIVLGFSASN